jgi:hypothetical protein
LVKVNIGGGHFNHPGWVNLDQRQGVKLSPQTKLPKADLVYSSHCFEHLDDETIDNLLSQIECPLVLKLPDFEQVLERWSSKDGAYFTRWGLESVVGTWKSRGVADNIDSRAAMIFCGWWNKEYGDEWGGRTPNAKGAYHGPAVLKSYREILKSMSPKGIADAFTKFVRETEDKPTFNHQNAWSRVELKSLLERHGFKVSLDQSDMSIPTINEMQDISMYAIAE